MGKTNQEYLDKAINTSLGGQLNTDDVDKFFDGVRDKAGFLSKIEWIGTDAGAVDLQAYTFNESDVLLGVEGTTPTHIGSGSIDERTITLTEAVLAYDITYNFFNHNVMGNDVDGYITDKMQTTLKNVIGLAYISGSSTNPNRQYQVMDGLVKKAKAGSVTRAGVSSSTAATDTCERQMKSMFDALDDGYKYAPETDLVYLVPWDFASQWTKEAGDRETPKGDQYKFSYGTPPWRGIPVVPVQGLNFEITASGSADDTYPAGTPVTELFLTKWENLKMGYSNRYGQFGVGVQDQPRKRLVEYTLNAYVGMNYVVADQVILGTISGSVSA
jgi:hypothetical protein